MESSSSLLKDPHEEYEHDTDKGFRSTLIASWATSKLDSNFEKINLLRLVYNVEKLVLLSCGELPAE